ncbi:hypothetical protein L2E82_32393 [Cichorium intybus]|uniref:Uncharacterized protein n=1 Tax=Cichorium intybus TaxID=13427 RepID=A0ACB9BIE1_CICIN|nr:hypothetical protein L2E82_32393 [Cichorium intybus]
MECRGGGHKRTLISVDFLYVILSFVIEILYIIYMDFTLGHLIVAKMHSLATQNVVFGGKFADKCERGKAEEQRKAEAAALHIGAGGGSCFRSGVVAAAGNYGGRKRSRWSEVAVYNFNLPHSSVTSDFEASIFPHHEKRKRTHHSYCSSSITSLKDPSGLCGVVTEG